MQPIHALMIILLHAAFGSLFLFLYRLQPTKFARYLAQSWFLEALRISVHFPLVRDFAGWSHHWYSISDCLSVVATWWLLVGCADLVGVQLPKRLGRLYLGISLPLILILRYLVPPVLGKWFGLSAGEAMSNCVQVELLVIFIPTTIVRTTIIFWFIEVWQKTRLTGARIAIFFGIPYAIFALITPIQFYLNYSPDWINVAWIVRVLGFSVGLLILVFDQQVRILQRSEERLRHIFDGISAFVGLFQPDGRVLEMNRTALASAGLRREDVVGRPFADAYWWSHSEDMQSRLRTIFARVARGEVVREDLLAQVSEGHCITVHSTFGPLHNAAGKVIQVVGSGVDISAHRQAQDELYGRERRFRALLEHGSDSIALISADNKIIYLSPAVTRVEGYTPDELLGRSPLEHTHPGDLDYLQEVLKKISANPGQPVPVLWRQQHKDGRWLWLEGVATNLLHDPAVAAIVANYRDVTERKRTEDSLRENQVHLIDAMRLARLAYWEYDVLADRFTFNDQFYSLLRTTAEREGGYTMPSAQYAGKFVHPEDAAIVGTEIMKALGTTDPDYHAQLDHRILYADGEVGYFNVHIRVEKDARGRTVKTRGANLDITERKSLESQLLRAQRMETVGTLASGVAHDLNNILTPMLMAAGLLRHKLVDESDRNVLTMMERNARRGASIIGQLLAFSRGVEGERAVIQVRHLIEEMVNIMRETFPRNIEIEHDEPTGLWNVLADATQIHQVIMNLCVNARDAMPAGGHLQLRAHNVQLGPEEARLHPLARPGAYLVLTVADSGHGIPPAIIDRIFDPFFTTKEVGKGSGLGLSTVLGITKSHGGFVTVQSVPGKGATFQVYLPAEVETPATEKGGSTPPLPSGRGELILIVDDEESVREAARSILEKFSYEVVVAGNGDEALRVLRGQQGRVRLVLTDMVMPGLEGLALIRSLREQDPGVRIVACSGMDHQEKRAELEALGVGEVLAKPYTLSELLRVVDHALNLKR
jgi:two-component system, cell cycle sensor histidine kinase and response regulator CckA